MAKRNSMSKARQGRKSSDRRDERADVLIGEAQDDQNSGQQSLLDAHHEAIEAERGRLMRAEAVLGSVAFTLRHAEWRSEDGTDYANVIDVARDIVLQSLTGLEPINLERQARGGTES